MTYKIIRFRFKGPSKVIKTGLTLEEARAHCQRADTADTGWFDGYTKASDALSEDAQKSVEKIADRFETNEVANAFINTVNLIAKAEAEGKFPPRNGGAS